MPLITPGRAPMISPGHPSTRRGIEREFWKEVAAGLSSEDAATAVGVSPAVGARWFRQGGGMPTIELAEPGGRYLSFAEREEIAILRALNEQIAALETELAAHFEHSVAITPHGPEILSLARPAA